MSVLDRFKDTSKYPRQMRELGMLIVLNRRKDPGIFLKDTDADRCGWFGKTSQFPDAEETEEEFGDDNIESGIPESFNVLIMELKSLGLNVELLESNLN